MKKRNFWDRFGPKLSRHYVQIMAVVLVSACMVTPVFALDDIWNSGTDDRLYVNYDLTNVLDQKKDNKRRLQEELGLVQDDHKFVIGLISRLTDQKGLDLVNAILPQIMDEHTQVVVLGTGDRVYEDSFRYYESAY